MTKKTDPVRAEPVREGLPRYLSSSAVRDAESADRAGYARAPATRDDLAAWDGAQDWPADGSLSRGRRGGDAVARIVRR